MSTVDQVFTAAGLWKWYSSTATNAYDGVNEFGIDFASSFGTPTGSPVAGTVVRTHQWPNSIGDQIEIQASDGSVWLFQHLTGKVSTGDKIAVGTVVGMESGLPVDQYSTGPHIEVRYAAPGTWKAALAQYQEPWINPASVYAAIGGTQAGSTPVGTPGGGNTPPPTNAPPVIAPIVHTLAPTADVTALLQDLDSVMILQNPFDVPSGAKIVGGTTIPDPFSWIEQFGTVLYNDSLAFVLRLTFVLVGGYMILKVCNEFIDYGQLLEHVSSTIGAL
jgi:hypothetical protein